MTSDWLLRSSREGIDLGLLPTEKTPAKRDITQFTTLIYGPPKIGKSTFCASADNAIFIATEAGLNHLDTYQVACGDWPTFLRICGEIAEGKHAFKTVVIDTIDNLYKLCFDHCVRKANIEHPSDLAYGKGWEQINGRMHRALTALSLLPYGLMMVSHSKDKELKTRTGTVNKTVPTISGGAYDVVANMADFILFAEAEDVRDEHGTIVETHRILHSQPTTMYEAGNRSQFVIPDPLPLDYQAFTEALRSGIESPSGSSDTTSDTTSTTATNYQTRQGRD